MFFPLEKKEEFNTYHTFVVQVDKRDELKKYLNKNGISTAIHYPIPIHLQPAYKKFLKIERIILTQKNKQKNFDFTN